MKLLAAVLFAALGIGQPAAVPMHVFLGPVPNPSGLTAPVADAEKASYADLRSEYQKDRKLRARIALAESADDADLILTIASRCTVSRSPQEDSEQSLTAQLTVVGAAETVDLDGATGITSASYKAQARNLLRQAADWGEANRDKIAKLRAGQ